MKFQATTKIGKITRSTVLKIRTLRMDCWRCSGFRCQLWTCESQATKRAFRVECRFRVLSHLIRMSAVGCTPDRVGACLAVLHVSSDTLTLCIFEHRAPLVGSSTQRIANRFLSSV